MASCTNRIGSRYKEAKISIAYQRDVHHNDGTSFRQWGAAPRAQVAPIRPSVLTVCAVHRHAAPRVSLPCGFVFPVWNAVLDSSALMVAAARSLCVPTTRSVRRGKNSSCLTCAYSVFSFSCSDTLWQKDERQSVSSGAYLAIHFYVDSQCKSRYTWICWGFLASPRHWLPISLLLAPQV